MNLSFPVHKLAKFSENPGKVQFEVFLYLLRYIRDNYTLGLKYYADINDAPVFELLRQASIKTENHLMSFSYHSWQDIPDTGRRKRAYIIFYLGEPIDHGTKFTGPVNQSNADFIDYTAACTAGMAFQDVNS